MADVAYVIQFDAPGNNRASRSSGGVDLFDLDFEAVVAPVLQAHDYVHLLDDPFTDVMVLRERFGINCLNLACGYYDAHTDREFVIPEDVFGAGKLGLDLARALNPAIRSSTGKENSVNQRFGGFRKCRRRVVSRSSSDGGGSGG